MNSRRKFKHLFRSVDDNDTTPRVKLGTVYRKMVEEELGSIRTKTAIATMFKDIPREKHPITAGDIGKYGSEKIRYLRDWVRKSKEEISSSEESDSDFAEPDTEEQPEEEPEENPGESMNTEAENFRFRSPIVHLTYKGHLDKGSLIEAINEKSKYRIVLYSVCHESGSGDKNTPYEHTHALFWFSGSRDSRSSRCFDYVIEDTDEVIHPHIKIPHMSLEPAYCGFFHIALVYHKKEDQEVYTNIPDFQWAPLTRKPTPKEVKDKKYKETDKVPIPSAALITACNGNMREIGLMPVEQARRFMAGIYARIITPTGKSAEPSIDKIYDACLKLAVDAAQPAVAEQAMVMRPWQEYWQMKIECRNRQQNRMVNYAYDQKGKFGKSEFISMMRKRSYKIISLVANGKSTLDNLSNLFCRRIDVQKLITRRLSEDEERELVVAELDALFLDVPRDCEELPPGFYGFIESVCNGQISSFKYAGHSYEIEGRPAIFVLSNRPPDISKFSLDRWAVHLVGPSMDTFEFEFLGSSAIQERSRLTEAIELSRDGEQVSQEVRDSMIKVSKGRGVAVPLLDSKGSWKRLFGLIGNIKEREKLWEKHRIRKIEVIEEPREDGGVDFVYRAKDVKMTERQIAAYEAYKRFHQGGDEDVGAPSAQAILDASARMLAKRAIRRE